MTNEDVGHAFRQINLNHIPDSLFELQLKAFFRPCRPNSIVALSFSIKLSEPHWKLMFGPEFDATRYREVDTYGVSGVAITCLQDNSKAAIPRSCSVCGR
jgi:hypothetical protein